jgi:hypothetical protein
MNLFLAQKTNPFKSKTAKIFAILLVCFFVGGWADKTFAQGYPVGFTNPQTTQPTNNGGSVNTTKTTSATASNTSWGGLLRTNSSSQTQVFKNYHDKNKVYGVITTNVATNSVLDGVTGIMPMAQLLLLAKNVIEAVKGDQAAVYEIHPDGSTTLVPNGGKDLLWSIDQMTPLPIDPTQLNSLTDSPLRYDFEDGMYVYNNPTTGQPEKIGISPEGTKRLEEIMKGDKKATEAVTASKVKADNLNAKVAESVSKGANQTDPKKIPDISCGFMGNADIMCAFTKVIYYITIKPASLFLAMSGWFLDVVFVETILKLGVTLGVENPTSTASFFYVIKMVWGIFRDLINMSFIFILLYASVMTILRADTANLKKTISNIIIVALLINFSLFFTQIIIDVSNNFAVTIYNTINQTAGNKPNTGVFGQAVQNNIAAAFMSRLSLQTLLETARPTANNTNYTAIISMCIFGSIFILILAVIFFVMAILLVVRFVEFIILMMMSPIGFGSRVLPKLGDAFDGSFWNNLLSQCFFAPIMLFFLWISIQMLEGVVAMANPGMKLGESTSITLGTALTDGATAAKQIGAYLLGFTVTIFMLIKGMSVAKSLSAKGASGVQSGFLKYSGADWLQNKMNNSPKGIAGATARNTMGRFATRALDNETFKNFASNNAFARSLYKGAQNTANAGFGGKGGFMKNEADAIKQKEKFREELGKKSFAIRQREMIEEEAQLKKVTAAKEKQDLAVKFQNIAKAEDSYQRLENFRNDTAESRKEIADKLDKDEDYKKAKQEVFDAVTEKGVAEAEAKIKKIEERVKKETVDGLEKTLTDTFNQANIHIDPKNKSTHDLALARLATEKSRIKAKDTEGEYQTKSLAELTEVAEKLQTQTKTEEAELKRILAAIKSQPDPGRIRQERYSQSLSSSSFGNLGMPSRASREASANIRKELNKGSDKLAEEKLLKTIRKMAKGEEGEKEEKPKSDKPSTAPKK